MGQVRGQLLQQALMGHYHHLQDWHTHLEEDIEAESNSVGRIIEEPVLQLSNNMREKLIVQVDTVVILSGC